MNHLRKYSVSVRNPEVKVSVTTVSSADGVEVCRVHAVFPDDAAPTPVSVQWEEDMVNILSVWHPTGGRGRGIHQWFAPTKNFSNFCFGAPVLCTVGENGFNTQTVSVSDCERPITMKFFVKDLDQQDKVGYSVTFFDGNCSPIKEYTADIRIDCREIPYYESILSVSEWWEEYGYTFPACPAEAEDALYSSWYNFHQAPDEERLYNDLKIASELGFRTVILDDGWQFAGPSSGSYSQCGEWQVSPDKFPDFKAFTEQVHRLGMKLLVWFSVPFVGVDSPVYRRFEGKYLYTDRKGMMAGVVDPRYPEVRAYIKETYKRFLRDYDIDGFKLDFIDSFRPGDTTAEFNEEMDCPTVEEAVKRLLEEIEEELAAIKPGLLFEYRQNYVGPAINRFGNMLRVADCAYDAMSNRIGIADLRLMGYPVAVHSDMLFWSKHEKISLCARQLLNILFGVPQISVILADSTQEQKELLKHYLDYWTENRDILLHGAFRPLNPEMNYPSISAENDSKRITALYADLAYRWDGKRSDVFWVGDADGMILENASDKMAEIGWFDCFGKQQGSMQINEKAMMRVPVPQGGMVQVR